MQSDDETMELAVTRKGIKEISSNTLIIKFPVRAGKCWAAGQSNKFRRFRVLSVNKPCSVSQLKIRDCITIGDEDASATGSKTVMTYGLDLGPVLHAYYQKAARKEHLVQTVTLTSHKFAGP